MEQSETGELGESWNETPRGKQRGTKSHTASPQVCAKRHHPVSLREPPLLAKEGSFKLLPCQGEVS